MTIPLLDLQKQYLTIQNEIDEAVQGVFKRGDYVLGQSVADFEKSFAEFCQASYAIGVGSGLDALILALRALEIQSGDEVIVPANTFVATTLAVEAVGAKPVLVDCREDDYTMDVSLVEEKITSKTKAVIPVHLYGQPVEMDPLLELAKKYQLYVVEDAAQAHGAEYKGRRCGSMGDLGCFSFYPGKNLGAAGDGGCIVTQDETLMKKLKKLRNYGSAKKYYHELKGVNSRLDTIQAAVLGVKLKHLEAWSDRRAEIAAEYTKLLKETAVLKTPAVRENVRHVFHLYVIEVEHRDEVLKVLHEQGIFAGIHYPIPIHQLECHQDLEYSQGDFPVSEQASKRILSLPLFAEVTQEQIEEVVSMLDRAMKTFEQKVH